MSVWRFNENGINHSVSGFNNPFGLNLNLQSRRLTNGNQAGSLLTHSYKGMTHSVVDIGAVPLRQPQRRVELRMQHHFAGQHINELFAFVL